MTSKEKQVIHLKYFDLRARGEPVRWILKILGIEFTEERIAIQEWQKKKAEFEWGKVPVLFVNEIPLHQTVVICKYLADCHNMGPSDPWEAARLQEVIESINDVAANAADTFYFRYIKQEDLSKASLEKWRAGAHGIAEIINNNITDEGWIRSKKMTYIDVFVAAYMEYVEDLFLGIYDKAPKLRVMVDNVKSLPAVKDWLQNRPSRNPYESVEELRS